MYGLTIAPQKSEKSYIFFCVCFVYKYRGGSNKKKKRHTKHTAHETLQNDQCILSHRNVFPHSLW